MASRTCHDADLGKLALGGLASSAELLVLRGSEEVLHRYAGGAVPGTRFLLYSVSKMLTATTTLALVSTGRLELGTRVADVLPGFAQGGKEDITVEEVLTHSSGFPMDQRAGAPKLLDPAEAADWEAFKEKVCATPVQPGLRGTGVYHALTFGILGAVVEESTGRPFREAVRDEVTGPLGMGTTTFGLPKAEQHLSAGFHGPGSPGWSRFSIEDALLPAGNAWSTATDVARLLLLYRRGAPPSGPAVVDARLAAEAIEPRVTMRGAHWATGLGFFVDTEGGRVFARGSMSAPGTFGHSGATATQAFHDPVNDLTLVCLTNSCVAQEESNARFDRLCDQVYGRYV